MEGRCRAENRIGKHGKGRKLMQVETTAEEENFEMRGVEKRVMRGKEREGDKRAREIEGK